MDLCLSAAQTGAELPTGLLQPPERRCLGGHEDAGYGAAGNDITVYFSGRSDKGTWRAEDGRICYEFTTIPSACNDVRLLGNDIYLKRSNGQMTQLLPR